jgi:hypothetical protein
MTNRIISQPILADVNIQEFWIGEEKIKNFDNGKRSSAVFLKDDANDKGILIKSRNKLIDHGVGQGNGGWC